MTPASATTRLSAAATWLAVACAAVGCSDGAAVAADAGPQDGASIDAGVGPAPPDIPWLADGVPPIAPPVLTPCATPEARPATAREVAAWRCRRVRVRR